MTSLAKFQRRHRGRFAAHWMVREGDKTVGPVSLELLERGIRAGKVPLTAEMALDGHDEWLPISKVLPNVKPEVECGLVITPAPSSLESVAAVTSVEVEESHVRAVPQTKREWPLAGASSPGPGTSSPQAAVEVDAEAQPVVEAQPETKPAPVAETEPEAVEVQPVVEIQPETIQPKTKPEAAVVEAQPETAPVTAPLAEPQAEVVEAAHATQPRIEERPIIERPVALSTLVSETDDDDWMRETVPKDWRSATAPCAPPSEIEAAVVNAPVQAEAGPSTDRMGAPETDPAPEVASEEDTADAAQAQRRAWQATTQRRKVEVPFHEQEWTGPAAGAEQTPFHLQAWDSQPPPAPHGSQPPQPPQPSQPPAPMASQPPHASQPPAPMGSHPPPAPLASQPPQASQPPPAKALPAQAQRPAEDLSPIPGPLPVPDRPEPVSQRFSEDEPVEIPKRGLLSAIFR